MRKRLLELEARLLGLGSWSLGPVYGTAEVLFGGKKYLISPVPGEANDLVTLVLELIMGPKIGVVVNDETHLCLRSRALFRRLEQLRVKKGKDDEKQKLKQALE